ncbi:hypothetical protein ASD65_10565 [Microbacterium sp. Root61]|nr:hypothetical protein ASD65_10565 [Microbacterium sp. Root61]
MADAGAQGADGQDTLFDRLGVRRVINGVGPATRLGGLTLHPVVVEAMREATINPVRMDDLERCAGRELARLLDADAAYVTSGAAAALTLATAAIIAGADSARMDQLPRIADAPHRVIVLAAHRDPYDRALEAAGAELVVVGYPHSTHIGEIERALDGDVAAVLYRPGRPGNHPTLAAIARLAGSRGVSVLVDGALYAPPLENLRRWLDDGAALVALSGGKHFRGPQASGILCGRADLVELVALLHQDMDEREQTWGRDQSIDTPPRHGIGRAMKVGREQIAGLVAAVERYVAAPGADDAAGIRELVRLRELLTEEGTPVIWSETSPLGVPVLELDLVGAGVDADAFANGLAMLETPVYLEESEVWRGALLVHPMALAEGDAEKIATSVARVIADLASSTDVEDDA